MSNLVVFDSLKAKAIIFVNSFKSMEVKDNGTASTATEALRTVSNFKKEIEAQRKEITDPLNAQIKLAIGLEKQITAQLDVGINHCKSQLRSWEMALALERAEKLRLAEEERVAKLEEAKVEAARNVSQSPEPNDWATMFDPAPAVPPPEQELAQATAVAQHERQETEISHQHRQAVKSIEALKVKGARKVWKFELTNEDLLPRAFMSANLPAIREFVNAGGRELTGVRIYEDTVIAAGRF